MWSRSRAFRLLPLLVISILMVTLVGCGSGRLEPVSLFRINVTGSTTAALQRGQTIQLSATGIYSNGLVSPLTNITWASADTSVATVSSTGLVTAVSRGTADIVASVSQVKGRTSVSVKGLAGGTIGATGGTITVNIPGNPSDGTAIKVPANSTADGKDVHIELDDQDALPGPLPQGATQASKVYLLEKDSKYNFAQPISITIPVDPASLANGELPLVFTWVQAEQKYRPSALVAIDRTKGTVTFKTAVFGTMVAISVPSLDVLAKSTDITTGFKPSVDGFFHPNVGSYETAGGACMGMAMFSEWYFGTKKKTDGTALFSKYLEGDVAKWQDDATAEHLIARTYQTTKNIWSLYANAATADESLKDAETALAAWIALTVTNEPQTLMIRFENGQAHAVTLHSWNATTKTFGIYDSNFPGDDTVTLGWDATAGFTNYSKAGAYSTIKSFTLLPIGIAMLGPEFERLYSGAESAWSSTKFDTITFNSPVKDANGNYIVDGSQALVVSGTVTPAGTASVRASSRALSLATVIPSSVVYSWNGTRAGTAPVVNGTFSFTIPAEKVVGYANTVSVISTVDPSDVWEIGGFEEITTHIKGAIFFNNPGFELGDFTGWTHETHTWSNFVPGSYTPEKSAIAGAGTDPLDPGLTTVYTGNYSARVNNGDNNLHISSVSQTVTVPAGGSPQIRFYWAAVLEDPQHDPSDQPYVDIKVTDDTAETVLYTRHFFANDPAYSGWISVQGGSWKVIRWQPVTIDVSGAVGHNITVKITAADCALSGHGGYAYFDGDLQ